MINYYEHISIVKKIINRNDKNLKLYFKFIENYDES
jgi:hypothetical protein